MTRVERLFDFVYNDYDNLTNLLETLLDHYPYLIEQMYPWLNDKQEN